MTGWTDPVRAREAAARVASKLGHDSRIHREIHRRIRVGPWLVSARPEPNGSLTWWAVDGSERREGVWRSEADIEATLRELVEPAQ